MAADVGSLARFPKIVGNESFTREVALTGREFNAKEALDVGFVSRVVTGGKEGVLCKSISLPFACSIFPPSRTIPTKLCKKRSDTNVCLCCLCQPPL